MSDNSFKLFASEPTPGHDPKHLVPHAKSTSDLVNTPPRDFMKGHEDEISHHDNHHHHRQKSEEPAAASAAPHPVASSEKKEVIRGPWRILRLLPRESRNIIHRMLDLNPKTRAGMDEILAEPWVADTIICQQLENGMVSSADDHTHILEPPANQTKPV
jgi:serine/threonine protein kinase